MNNTHFFRCAQYRDDHANEPTIPAQVGVETYFVDVHVANDGVGVRLRLPAKMGRKVQADESSWKLSGDPAVWADKFEAAYESPYHQTSFKQIGSGSFALPLTVRIGKLYVTLTEAMVKEFGDLSVKLDKDGALAGELYADPPGMDDRCNGDSTMAGDDYYTQPYGSYEHDVSNKPK